MIFCFSPSFPSCYFRGMIVLLVSFFRSRVTPVSITVSVVVPSYNINNLFCQRTFISRVKSENSRVWTGGELNHIARIKGGKDMCPNCQPWMIRTHWFGKHFFGASSLEDIYKHKNSVVFWGHMAEKRAAVVALAKKGGGSEIKIKIPLFSSF